MKRIHHITAFALTATIGLSSLSIPLAARASEEGKRNTALGLGAAAVALLLTQKNKLPGIVAAGGAAYAYSQYNNDVQNRYRRERDGYYDYRQENGYRYGHENANGYGSQNDYHEENGYRVHQEDNQNYRYNRGEDRAVSRRPANRSPR